MASPSGQTSKLASHTDRRYAVVRQGDGSVTVVVSTWAEYAERMTPPHRPMWRRILGGLT
jgi:hypothetical protein